MKPYRLTSVLAGLVLPLLAIPAMGESYKPTVISLATDDYSNCKPGVLYTVDDATSTSDCATGGGSTFNVCLCSTPGTLVDEDASGSGAFSDAGDPIVQNTTTKDVHFGDGAGTLVGKVEIGGDADQPQLVVEGFSTQTDSIFIIQTDADTEVFTVGNDGTVDSAAPATAGGQIVLKEGTDDGSNTFTLKVPDTGLSADKTCTTEADGDIPQTCLGEISGGAGFTDATLTEADLASEDYGDFTCGASADDCLIDNQIFSVPIAGGAQIADGTQCADPAKATVNSIPMYTVICTDNDASSIYFDFPLPDSYDGGTFVIKQTYIQTAADTSALNGDVSCFCRDATESGNTYGTEIAMDDAAVTGSNGEDEIISAAVTGTGCSAGESRLFCRWQMDATGTTTAVATLHFTSWLVEYTSTVGD